MKISIFSQLILIFSILLMFFASLEIIRKPNYGLFGLMFCIYFIIFYSLPAILHIETNIFPFYSLSYDENIIFTGSVLSFIFILFGLIGYFFSNKIFNMRRIDSRMLINLNISEKKVLIIIFIYLIIQLVSVNYFGAISFLVRRDEFDSDAFGSSSYEQTMLLNGIRGISFICILFAWYFLNKKKFIGKVVFILCFLLFFIINFPTAISRFQFFSYVLCFLILEINLTKLRKMFIFCLFVLGVTTIFPYISYLSRGDGEFIFDPVLYYSQSGDFDGFQSFLNVINFVNENGVSYGYQLLGAIFAYIPRAIWFAKPLPTGVLVAEFSGYDFTNISAPIVSEMYIDFGYFGLTIFAFLIGSILRKFDNDIISLKKFNVPASMMLKAIFFSFLIIFFRGSLSAVVAPFFIEAFVCYFSIKFIIYNKK